jgi:RNA polymerase sigma-70 factor, ECF subfamily
MGMELKEARFETLVRAYAPDLYRFARWLGNGREQAEDLVQETCMRAWRALDSLQDPKAAKSWMLTILRREHARQYEGLRVDLDPMGELELERLADMDAGFGRTETFVLRRALVRLPLIYREPLLLQVLGGYSSEEIARLLGIKPGAVTTRLFRARKVLRKYLEGTEPERVDHEKRVEI